MSTSREDRIIFAARHYTEYRRPDGSTYVEHHRQKPKRQHGVRQGSWDARRKSN